MIKPPHPEDMEHASLAIYEAKRLASIVRGRVSGRMNPKGLEWHEASELGNATETVAYHARWMFLHLNAQDSPTISEMQGELIDAWDIFTVMSKSPDVPARFRKIATEQARAIAEVLDKITVKPE